jgi:hypothetical protein
MPKQSSAPARINASKVRLLIFSDQYDGRNQINLYMGHLDT